MKRLALSALLAALPASAADPVSAYPKGQPVSLNQPLPAAVQSAIPAGPPPATLLGSPNWGAPAAPCAETAPACPQAAPYTDVLAPRGVFSGQCLSRFKEWISFQPAPGGPGCRLFPYQVPARYYFKCGPADGSFRAGEWCGAGGNCGKEAGCPAVGLPVRELKPDCGPAGCMPRVQYQPQCATAAACDTGPRPRLLARLFGQLGPVAAVRCRPGDGWCAPADGCAAPAAELLPAAPALSTVPTVPPVTPPQPMTPPLGTKPAPTVWKTPTQPLTNP